MSSAISIVTFAGGVSYDKTVNLFMGHRTWSSIEISFSYWCRQGNIFLISGIYFAQDDGVNNSFYILDKVNLVRLKIASKKAFTLK